MNIQIPTHHFQAAGSSGGLAEVIEELAHYLPSQPPLHAFVHHNTLHHFESQPFEEAVVTASQLFNTEPFLSEQTYFDYLNAGRITQKDINAVIEDAFDDNDQLIYEGGITLREFRTSRFAYQINTPNAAAINFLIYENQVNENFDKFLPKQRRDEILFECALGMYGNDEKKQSHLLLKSLWSTLEHGLDTLSLPVTDPVRTRDLLLPLTNTDTDEIVHPLLIRVCGAFLDQGVSHWPMQSREKGFLYCFRDLYRRPFSSPNTPLKGLSKVLDYQATKNYSATDTIEWALIELQIPPENLQEFILSTLLALRGWAGMFRHLEERPDRAPIHEAYTKIEDFLAVRLILDVVAARNLMKLKLGRVIDYKELLIKYQEETETNIAEEVPIQLLYEAYLCAQYQPINLSELLDKSNADNWLATVYNFNNFERRKILHLAYERRYRSQILDSLTLHSRFINQQKPLEGQSAAQIVFCIDDREESIRRHLEEILPNVETFGFAGFFGAAISYQGVDDIRPRPLCPVVVQPKHYIQEVVPDEEEHKRYKASKKRQGKFKYNTDVASKTLTRGSVFSALFGWLSIPSLILRSLSPGLYLKLTHLTHSHAEKPNSRIILERSEEQENAAMNMGYSVLEMTDIVEATLVTMNLTDKFSSVVIFVGHGSSSLNNPHEAAHDCGATGGGRGGPNARVFAAMANHPTVRENLIRKNIVIPANTWFVGAYHNTCDDHMTYYDEDLVPEEIDTHYQKVKQAISQACVMDAHERCRRFRTTPDHLPPEEALEYAQIHANDLAEPRPEYGHATNSICIVGRRERTKGLFLDRRAFLVSYDPEPDTNGNILTNLLLSVGPVGAGINLEYYFSFVDPKGYGCGTKLPHNITGLIGVMDGHASDLRTGLPWQMVEIHEPVRLLLVVEAKLETLATILENQPGLATLINNRWIQLAALDPDSEQCHFYGPKGFTPHNLESLHMPVFEYSSDYYFNHREHLPPAHVRASFREKLV